MTPTTSRSRRWPLAILSVAAMTTAALATSADAGAPPPDLVISEIMYNPASAENDWEWVEVYNPGSSTVDLSGFVIDDINSLAVSAPNIVSGSIAPGGTAVLYNADDLSVADFEGGWGTGINLVAVTDWNAMSLNNGGDTVSLWENSTDHAFDHDTHANALVTVAYDDSGSWPSDNNAGSIFLTDLAADANNGSNWALSTVGASTPAGGKAYQSAAAGGNSGNDIASPGGTLPEPPTPTALTIPEIQGAAHTSPYLGELVETDGIVTAVDSNAFYLQDPTGDGDTATSDAIVVFSGSRVVAVGDDVTVVGTVSEFTPGGAATRNLSTSQISLGSFTVNSAGNALPAATMIGTGGRIPPTEVIDDDAFASFDQDDDGIDFYESMEAMLVTVKAPTAVAGTTRFGELWTVPDGVDATSVSERGTMNISLEDFNPERVQIDEDSGVANITFPFEDTGASFGDITGVVGYSFGNFEVIPTGEFADTTVPSTLEPETTELAAGGNHLAVASFNVLNLDPNDFDGDQDIADGRFDAIAAQIVDNLGTPDVVALQEVQDNNGSDGGGITAADVTLQTLVDAIVNAGGPSYEFIDNTFIGNNTSGGQPEGNIRTAYLYNPDRVVKVGPSSTISDQSPTGAFFGARLPLVQVFQFRGNDVTVVNNHFSSKGGSAPLYGTAQNSTERQEDVTVNGSLDERQVQSAAVKDFVDDLLATDPDADMIVLGDLNEFEFISPVLSLAESLTNLTMQLPPDERYTFIFDGNSQSLDHILVSDGLNAVAEFDAVHVNAEYAAVRTRASDHDPLVSRFTLEPSCTILGTVQSDHLVGTDGPDVICAGNGEDTVEAMGGDDVVYGDNGKDSINGGPGNDELFGGNAKDTLVGGLGSDLLDGGNGTDSCDGGPGDNELLNC